MVQSKNPAIWSLAATWDTSTLLPPPSSSAPPAKRCVTTLCAIATLVTIALLIAGGLKLVVTTPKTVVTEPHQQQDIRSVFVNNSYSAPVQFLSSSSATQQLVADDIFWSAHVEAHLPTGYGAHAADAWRRYVNSTTTIGVRLERGCGRMQNRLLTFADGRRACVRYRQNTDQIQGELFSFYLARLLGLRNLAPSALSIVDLGAPLWQQLGSAIASAAWSSQRAVVLTQYLPDLDAGNIPKLVRPAERHHLNRRTLEASTPEDWRELAQWSDLIVFDYLTANLDRVVNNLYNYQWNSNIMEAPAHNLAKEPATELLVFLDNESGLLHGYRLLEKYEPYHGLLLENLCVFRRSTVEAVRRLVRAGDVGLQLRRLFEAGNAEHVRDALPGMPEKSVKILNGRLRRVHEQIVKCGALFAR